MNEFIQKLKQYRGIMPKQLLLTLRGQALSGDLKGAEKGFAKWLTKLETRPSKI